MLLVVVLLPVVVVLLLMLHAHTYAHTYTRAVLLMRSRYGPPTSLVTLSLSSSDHHPCLVRWARDHRLSHSVRASVEPPARRPCDARTYDRRRARCINTHTQ